MFHIHLDRVGALSSVLSRSAGETYLRTMATQLRERLGPADVIAGIGGNEFVVVAAEPTDSATAEQAGGAIQRLFGRRVAIGGEVVEDSASVGVAVGIPGTSVGTVLHRADRALLSTRAAGGNIVAVFTDALRARLELQDDIELNLRPALADGSLVLHYQPEVELRTGRITADGSAGALAASDPGLLPPSSRRTTLRVLSTTSCPRRRRRPGYRQGGRRAQ
ncbi:diguanylate cyclase [Nocardia sp. 2YAB30]|uniref:diguanylate cyclase domain-containing protein n=1 Tax=unclassified Nocardia TaxID=2637762 RepID=UPI003F98D0FC